MITLEEELDAMFAGLGTTGENRELINNYLRILKIKDQATYEHSVRVGLLSVKIARHMHLDPKALLFAGTLHDIGKILIMPETLKKTAGFNEQDMELIRKHPEYTYNLLRGIHEFSAEVALRHHRFQENGYPRRLPKSKIPFSANTQIMIDFFARILSLADFYDAITSRVNDKFGDKRKLAPDEVKPIIIMKNQDQRYLIEDLYVNGIFGEQEEKPVQDTSDFLYNSIWQGWNGNRNPKETRRFITLACALEPLSDKLGCTTRSTNISRHLKLEYFIAGAINIGDAFEELCQRVLDDKKQPQLIYDLAYKAQADCKKNRGGGRINQGIIEMLIPIVTAQMIFDQEYKMQPNEILGCAKEILQGTTQQDVEELLKMKRLAYDLSEYRDRQVPRYDNVDNVYSYYNEELQHSQKPTSIKHNEEFVNGFPTIIRIHDLIMGSRKKGFNNKVEEAYSQIRKTDHSEVGPGLTADCTAAGIYLVLSHHPKDKVII